MPHKRNKFKRSKQAEMLVTRENVNDIPIERDRDNILPNMDDSAVLEVTSMIRDRYDAARETTDKIAGKMDKWEKQYNGEWNEKSEDDERIFLPKTKEQVQAVYSHILNVVNQMTPLVTMKPMVSSVWASSDEYKRAKIAEALVNYHMEDLWNFKEEILPAFLKTFLKFTLGVAKITYREDSTLPDLNIEIVDRALLYIDPAAHDISDSRWVIEKYFLTRTEVMQRIEDGHWYLPDDKIDRIDTAFTTHGVGTNHQILKRLFGANYADRVNLAEDELVEIWDYWQAEGHGVNDVYGVILGGENGHLVRYGRNPYPYKGIPYRGKSFNPHEYQVDGTGLVEEYRPVQELVNTFLNYRITDVRKNIIRPVAATGRFIDKQTQEDFKNGNKIVRLAEDVMEASQDPSFDLRKHFVELPFSTSTQELLVGDLPFILGQGKETTNISDVFRGQAPPRQATLGQVQEQLTQNQGVFMPVILQVMRFVEEIAEISLAYFQHPDFFPAERIIQVVGKNRYQDTIDNWHQVGGDMQVREVSPDDMDVNVTINAVSGAEAIASRTFLMQSLERIFQSIGQIPELFQELKGELNFSRIVEMMLNNSGHDIEALRMSPEEQERKAQEEQQAQQAALQQQQQQFQLQLQMQTQIEQMKAQMAALVEQQKQVARAQAQIAIDSNKANFQDDLQADRITMEREKELDLNIARNAEELQADLIRMEREAELERANAAVSVGHDGNNINTRASSTN